MNRKSNLWENFNLLALIFYFHIKKGVFFFFNVCFVPPDINVFVFKITRQFWSVIRVFKQHLNVQFLGGGAAVDLRFQFQEGVDFKNGVEKLQAFEVIAKCGNFLKGHSDTCLVFTMFT